MSGFPPLAVRSMKEGEAWSSAGWVPMQGWQGQKEELTGALFLLFSHHQVEHVGPSLPHPCLPWRALWLVCRHIGPHAGAGGSGQCRR